MRLTQSQVQKPVLSQQIQQMMRLLQYTQVELEGILQEEVLHNPFLSLDSPPSRQSNSLSYDYIAAPVSFRDKLKQDVFEAGIDEDLRPIVNWWIDNLDEKGFIETSVEEAALVLRCSVEVAEHGLIVFQKLMQNGVGARSLQECFLLQCNETTDPLLPTLLQNHFELFLQKKWSQLVSLYNISYARLQEAFHQLTCFQWRPVTDQEKLAQLQRMTPDFELRKEEGVWNLFVAIEDLPVLSFDQTMYEWVLTNGSPEVYKYAHKHHTAYQQLMRSLQYRQETLQRIMRTVLQKQPRFIEEGISALVPLTQAEIAHEVEVHESTVSRAIQGKTMQTPFGLITCQMLFSANSVTSKDSNVTNQSIKGFLKKLVAAENKTEPYSDQTLMTMLQERGIEVSRRTIAKYRSQLGIPSTKYRKEYTNG